mgnify:CR=1 FL=1
MFRIHFGRFSIVALMPRDSYVSPECTRSAVIGADMRLVTLRQLHTSSVAIQMKTLNSTS